jgi:hypothetical protein
MPQRHRPELSDSVVADPVGSYTRAARTFRPDRRCATPGCLTVLSIYNGAKHCAAHNPKQLRVIRPRRAPETAASRVEMGEGGVGPKTMSAAPPRRTAARPDQRLRTRAS